VDLLGRAAGTGLLLTVFMHMLHGNGGLLAAGLSRVVVVDSVTNLISWTAAPRLDS
jgi:hypothetical protein